MAYKVFRLPNQWSIGQIFIRSMYVFHRFFTERFRVFNVKISRLDSKYSKNSKHKHTLYAFLSTLHSFFFGIWEEKHLHYKTVLLYCRLYHVTKLNHHSLNDRSVFFAKLNSQLIILIMSFTWNQVIVIQLLKFYRFLYTW